MCQECQTETAAAARQRLPGRARYIHNVIGAGSAVVTYGYGTCIVHARAPGEPSVEICERALRMHMPRAMRCSRGPLALPLAPLSSLLYGPDFLDDPSLGLGAGSPAWT